MGKEYDDDPTKITEEQLRQIVAAALAEGQRPEETSVDETQQAEEDTIDDMVFPPGSPAVGDALHDVIFVPHAAERIAVGAGDRDPLRRLGRLTRRRPRACILVAAGVFIALLVSALVGGVR